MRAGGNNLILEGKGTKENKQTNISSKQEATKAKLTNIRDQFWSLVTKISDCFEVEEYVQQQFKYITLN